VNCDWHYGGRWAIGALWDGPRITAMIGTARALFADVKEKQICGISPQRIPHSIQGLEPDGTEFMLVIRRDGKFFGVRDGAYLPFWGLTRLMTVEDQLPPRAGISATLVPRGPPAAGSGTPRRRRDRDRGRRRQDLHPASNRNSGAYKRSAPHTWEIEPHTTRLLLTGKARTVSRPTVPRAHYRHAAQAALLGVSRTRSLAFRAGPTH